METEQPESLWINMGFLVVDTDAPLADVLEALPVPAVALNEAPRRFALSELIHLGDGNAGNRTELAVFHEPGLAIVAPPGSCFHYTGELDWPEALSRRFGRVWAFSTNCAAAALMVFDGGTCVDEVSEYKPAPADGGVLGVSTLRDEDAEIVLAAMGRLLGTSDIKALLRRGTCTLCRAEPQFSR
ncbi:MAG TPA: hypothetical protein VHW23_05760 [Kofleriaceae bacterium]|jgi:hypothetical protein|nr:hypothetical protein [Kofleriaceae bacterium]